MSTRRYVACEKNHVDAARLCLDRGAHVDAVQQNGFTSLHVACAHGHAAAAELLLDRGATVDVQPTDPEMLEEHATPLRFACEMGYVAVTRLCLDRGADNAHLIAAANDNN